MSEVIRHNKVDLSKINYTKPTNQRNVYYGSIDYNSTPCYIQTTKLTIQEIKEENKQTYLVGKVDPKDFSFYDLLVTLDDHNLSTTYKYSKEWFNKELPMDVLENMYRRITKPFMKDDVPIIELKVPIQKQSVQSKVYDQSNNTIDFNKLSKGSVVVCIIHIKGLKFLKKDYYCDTYISQIKLCEDVPYLIPSECLIDLDADDYIMYDYEINDEEAIQKHKEKNELEEKINILSQKLADDQKILLDLQQKIDNLN